MYHFAVVLWPLAYSRPPREDIRIICAHYSAVKVQVGILNVLHEATSAVSCSKTVETESGPIRQRSVSPVWLRLVMRIAYTKVRSMDSARHDIRFLHRDVQVESAAARSRFISRQTLFPILDCKTGMRVSTSLSP